MTGSLSWTPRCPSSREAGWASLVMRISSSASRFIELPAAEVFDVACRPENLIWIKGCFEPRIAEGDGLSPGSTLAWRDLLNREIRFEVLERRDARFRIRGFASYGLLEGELSIEATTDGCEAIWTCHHNPEHLLERILVTVAGPFGRRASIRDAENELERLERVVRWHRSGRRGFPLGEGREMLAHLTKNAEP